MPGGRPTKLTPQLQERICKLIRQGNYREVAARACGVGARTLKRWCKQGRDADDKNDPHKLFWHAVLKSEQRAEIKMVGIVLKAAQKDPKCAQWYLERKFFDRWGNQRHLIRELDKRLKELEKRQEDLLARGALPGTHLPPGCAPIPRVEDLTDDQLAEIGAEWQRRLALRAEDLTDDELAAIIAKGEPEQPQAPEKGSE